MSWSRSALVLFLLPVQGPGLRPEDPVRALLRDLEPLTKWCAENRLPREHHRCCAILVHFVPDHAEARQVLQFIRLKDGTWKQSPRYAAPKSTNEKLLPEFQQRFETLATAFRKAVLAELPDADPVRRTRLLADLLAVLPDDESGREATGEVKSGDRWFLRESVATKKRAPALQKAADASVAGVEAPKKYEPNADEKTWRTHWTSCLQSGSLRVLAGVGADEATTAASSAAAALDLFHRTFLVETRLQYGLTLVLLEPADKNAFLAKVKFPKQADRELAERVSGFWIPQSSVVVTTAETPELREEFAVRQTIADLLRTEFGITSQHGALFEGVGLYLSWLVLDRRATFFVGPDRYGRVAGSLRDKLSGQKADWLEEATKLVDRGAWLEALLRKDVQQMEAEDLPLAFAVAAWMLEGSLPLTPRFLRAAGARQENPAKLLPAHFGSDAAGVEARIRRWLGERKQLSPNSPG